MLKKLFMGFIAICFILFGSLILMMGYVFTNPGSVVSVFNSMTDKFVDSQEHDENEEFFIQGLENLHINSQKVDINLHTYSGASLKIRLHGKVPRFDSGPYIQQEQDNDSLIVELHEPVASQWVQFNINGHTYTKESDSNLTADIYVPDTFKKKVIIFSRFGNVTLNLPREGFYETDLSSESGKIQDDLKIQPTADIKPESVGHISVSTGTGSITVKPL
jgi:hypothetical protein